MNSTNQTVIIVKLNLQREETWRYEGRILKKDDKGLLIEAFFNREDLLFHGITLKQDDRFIERYFSSRWYNIFEIHDRDDDHLKGWYCNVTRPPEFSPGKIAYVDLALDVLVFPDGKFLVLDEEEFSELPLDARSRQRARQGLRELVEFANQKKIGSLTK